MAELAEPRHLCLCAYKGCGTFFLQVWPPDSYCPEHRLPRVVAHVTRQGETVYVLEGKL
jgi:hypothetical protein